MKPLKFFDVSTKKTFISNKYTLSFKKSKTRTTYFAIIKSPTGAKIYRIVSKDFYLKSKK